MTAVFFRGTDGEVGVPESDEHALDRNNINKIVIGQEEDSESLAIGFIF
jgi:hypothetical protein